jgi:hypothetical protein
MHSSLSLGVRGVCGSFCTAECFECPRCFRRFASTGEVAESPSMMRQESNAVSACRLQHPLKRTGFVPLFVTLVSVVTTVRVAEQSPPPPNNTETHVQNMATLRRRACAGRINAGPVPAAAVAIRCAPISASAASLPPCSVWSGSRRRVVARIKQNEVRFAWRPQCGTCVLFANGAIRHPFQAPCFGGRLPICDELLLVRV